MYLFFNDCVFLGAEREHAGDSCGESIDRGGERRGGCMGTLNRRVWRASSSQRAVSLLWLAPSKPTWRSVEWHDLFLQIAGANWLSFQRQGSIMVEHSHPRHNITAPCHSEWSRRLIAPNLPLTAKSFADRCGLSCKSSDRPPPPSGVWSAIRNGPRLWLTCLGTSQSVRNSELMPQL